MAVRTPGCERAQKSSTARLPPSCRIDPLAGFFLFFHFIFVSYTASKLRKTYQYLKLNTVGHFKRGKMARRTRLEVLGSILEICRRGGASKTRIVYQINPNFKTPVHIWNG